MRRFVLILRHLRQMHINFPNLIYQFSRKQRQIIVSIQHLGVIKQPLIVIIRDFAEKKRL
jgi:hypothetical protein